MGGSPKQITKQCLMKQQSLQLKQKYLPLYDSPPQESGRYVANSQKNLYKPFSEISFSNSSADYNTINSASSTSNDYTNLKSKPFRNGSLEGRNEKIEQMPIPSAPPLSLIGTSHSGMLIGSRLQQKTIINQRFSRTGLPTSNIKNIFQVLF